MRRLNHLDALRSGAMLVVVVWHVTIFWPTVVPLSPSTVAVIEWPMALSRWSLPLFFLMAGFFGATLLKRWSTKRFARDRLLRIGLPLLVGLFTVVPLTRLILGSMPHGIDGGPMHLWFLWYVLLFYAVLVVVPELPRVQRALARLLGSAWAAPALAAITVGLVFAVHLLPEPPAVWLFPNPGLVAFYGSFFAVGALVQRTAGGMDSIGDRLGLNVALALTALVPTVLLRTGPIWDGPSALAPSIQGYLWMASFVFLAWSSTFAVCGLGRRWLAVERPAMRYVADSSYWAYLAHFPLAVALVLLIAPLPLPFPVAWLLVVTLLFAILIGLYELMVRHSFVGRVLNGRRPPRRWSLSAARRPHRDRVPRGATG